MEIMEFNGNKKAPVYNIVRFKQLTSLGNRWHYLLSHLKAKLIFIEGKYLYAWTYALNLKSFSKSHSRGLKKLIFGWRIHGTRNAFDEKKQATTDRLCSRKVFRLVTRTSRTQSLHYSVLMLFLLLSVPTSSSSVRCELNVRKRYDKGSAYFFNLML